MTRRLLPAEVFDQVREQILRGEIEPGSALPAERAMAASLGVNRNAVREGLKRLEQAGLVAIQQGGATRVLDFRRSAGLELLGHMVQVKDGELDPDLVRGILEVRIELAPLIGRLAALRATAKNLKALERVLRYMREAAGNTLILARVSFELWSELASATGNLALEIAFNSLAVSYRRILEHVHHAMADKASAIDDYAALIRAVEQKNPEAAAQLAKGIAANGEAAAVFLRRPPHSIKRQAKSRRAGG